MPPVRKTTTGSPPATSNAPPWSPPNEIAEAQGFSGLIFGHPGCGKTTLLCSAVSAESGSPLLVVNFDQRTDSIRDRSDLMVWPGKSSGGVIKSWQYAVAFLARLSGGNHPFKTIGFDTVNNMYALALRHVKATTNHRDPRQTYGEANDLVLAIITEWAAISREQGINVIFTCHDGEKKDGEDGPIYIRPDVTPGVIKGLYQSVANIGYLEERMQRKRRLVLHNKLNVIAKVHQPQSGEQLDLEIDNPNLGKIIDHLRGVSVYPRAAKKGPDATR